MVGSENSIEQVVVGEIVAQHLEHRLQRKIDRRLGLGDETILYQAIASGDVTLYPDYPGAIETTILKERPDPNAAILLERARNEMRRTSQLELMDPLGYDSTPVVVVKNSDAAAAKVKTLSDAENGTFRWKLGVSYDFQQRADGLGALTAYKIPMSQGARGMEATGLFPALAEEQVSMIAVSATDGHLVSPNFTVLADDRKVFAAYQACLLVRADALIAEPKLRSALAELSGRLSTATMRKLDAAVEIDHRRPADVAAGFLEEAGLK